MLLVFLCLPGFAFLAWVTYLFFLGWVIHSTRDPAALGHVAEAARAFPCFIRTRAPEEQLVPALGSPLRLQCGDSADVGAT